MKFLFSIYGLIIFAAIIGGGSIGFMGTFIVGMRISFLGIVISHAAMAGAILGHLLGVAQFPMALLVAAFSTILLGFLMSPDLRRESQATLSILFSLMIGLVFLLMGMVRDDLTPVMGLMWGSLLFIKPGDLVVMIALSVIMLLFTGIFYKELKAILFSRSLSYLSGIPVRLVSMLFFLMVSGVITANLNIMGGLLLYSLITCPAAAAYELGKTLRSTLLLSTFFGIISASVGLWISFFLDLPTGACITLSSVFIFSLVYWWRKHHPSE